MSGNGAAAYSQVHGFECNEVADGYVIYDHVHDQVHFLNPTAALVFELCDGHINVDAMAQIVQEAFSLQTAPKADIEECLASLLSQGVIEPRAVAAPSA